MLHRGRFQSTRGLEPEGLEAGLDLHIRSVGAQSLELFLKAFEEKPGGKRQAILLGLERFVGTQHKLRAVHLFDSNALFGSALMKKLGFDSHGQAVAGPVYFKAGTTPLLLRLQVLQDGQLNVGAPGSLFLGFQFTIKTLTEDLDSLHKVRVDLGGVGTLLQQFGGHTKGVR